MKEGVNSGRICPWSKDYLLTLYNKLDKYCKTATILALKTDGQKVAMETMAAYNLFKYPVVYVFVHYHFGRFEDLNMSQNDISSYMMFLPMVKHFSEEILKGLNEQPVFSLDTKNELSPALVDVCREVIFIENNF